MKNNAYLEINLQIHQENLSVLLYHSMNWMSRCQLQGWHFKTGGHYFMNILILKIYIILIQKTDLFMLEDEYSSKRYFTIEKI